MTRSNVVADILYKSAVSLKAMDFKRLKRKKIRKNVISTLSMMQFLNQCIAMKQISEDQAKIILSVLSNTYAYDTSEITTLLRESHSGNGYSENYYDLLFHMNLILSSCIKELNDNYRGCAENARKYIAGFHNLPRAFLSLTDKRTISPEQAWEYARPYFEHD